SLAGSAAAQEQAVDYRFDDVKRRVTVTKATQQEWRVEKGQHAQSGDKVQTGWFSYALIASDRHRAKFEIFSSTDVQLASGTPGLILSLERGRIRAVFDKITGNEPRVVQTPGALLAVRGTRYDVEVDGTGRTTVDVWEGRVEIRSTLLGEPLLLEAGQESVFGRREIPLARPMPEERRRNAPDSRDRGRDPQGPRDDGHHGNPRGTEGHGRDHPDGPPHGSGHSGPPPKPPLLF
ncbi:MAG: FecR family protein, partial [Thermoanaerobaculia bacterium]